MRSPKYLLNALVGVSAVVFAGAELTHSRHDDNGPVLTAAAELVKPTAGTVSAAIAPALVETAEPANEIASETKAALDAFSGTVRTLSRSNALESAFRSYFAYKAANPNEVRKPYLYFVDYGLASTEARGWVFDMNTLTVVDGPFMVAHGRGSSTSQYGVPTRFSNAPGSASTSLGLYVAKATYQFVGHTAGRTYRSIGVRLKGVSTGFNDQAFARGVVTHGAPYVTASRAGRSEGCPAMEPGRAERLLPRIAEGGMVFLFAPNENWLANDRWIQGG